MTQENYIREKLNEIIDNIRTQDTSIYSEPDFLHLFNSSSADEFEEIKAMLKVMVKYSERLQEIIRINNDKNYSAFRSRTTKSYALVV